MRSTIIGFVAGAGWLQMQASLPGFSLMLILAGGAVALGMFNRVPRAPLAKAAMRFIAGMLAGFVWAAAFAHYYLTDELPRELEGKDITIVGTVDSLPYQFERGVRFNFSVEDVQDALPPGMAVPRRLALSWYSGFDAEGSGALATPLPGERWQLTVRLRRPHGNANPHGFNYEAWLLEQRLRATGYVRTDARAASSNVQLDSFVPGPRNFLERLRYRVREKIMSVLPGKEYAGIVVALVVGDQRGIAQSDWEIFNRSGIGHLISTSGS